MSIFMSNQKRNNALLQSSGEVSAEVECPN